MASINMKTRGMETVSLKALLELASSKSKIVFFVFLASLGLIFWSLWVSAPGLLLPEQVTKWSVPFCIVSGCYLLATFIWNIFDFLWNKRLRPWLRRRTAEKLEREKVKTLRLNLLAIGLRELAQLSNARILQNRQLSLNPDNRVYIELARSNLIKTVPRSHGLTWEPNVVIDEDAWELIQKMDEFDAENPEWLKRRYDAPEIKHFIDFLPQSHPSVISFNASSNTDFG